MKTQVLQLLNQTTEMYEAKTFELWMRWCESVTGTQSEFQMALCNRPLSNWFVMELQKAEARFLEDVQGFENATWQDYHKQYYMSTICLFNWCPPGPIADIKRELKQTSKTQQTAAPTKRKLFLHHHQLN